MSSPMKMSEKNSSPATSPKSTQGEIEVKEPEKFISSPEMNIVDPGQVKIMFFVFMFKKKFTCEKVYAWLDMEKSCFGFCV